MISLSPNKRPLASQLLDRGKKNGPCISIYVSRDTGANGRTARQLRLIRLLRTADKLLTADHGEERALEIMRKLWKMEPQKLLEAQHMSLALFHSPQFTGYLQIPQEVPELAVVANSFHIRPIISWLQNDWSYYLLSLSQKRVRLYRGSSQSLELVHEREADERFLNKLNSKEERNHNAKSEFRPRERIRRFFAECEDELHRITSKDRLPVILAGVGYLHPIYRSVNRDQDLIQDAIFGNVDRWSEEDLRRNALEIVNRLQEYARQNAVRQYLKAEVDGKATDDLGKVAKAVFEGKVQTLIISQDRHLFGELKERSGRIVLHPHQINSRDDDVLDDLAEAALARGGRVLSLSSFEMPSTSPVAAIFRW